MPLSPINFAATDTNPIKLFGGNILEVPSNYRPIPTDYWQYQWANWSTLFDSWVKPQMRNWRSRGGNIVRHLGASQGVLDGTFTQAYYEARVGEMVAECRAQGLLFSMCSGINGYSTVATDPTFLTRVRDSNNSLLQNVLIPNQDVIAYFEAGQQEHANNDASAQYLAVEARKVTSIPLLISFLNASNPANFNSCPAYTLFAWHRYASTTSLQAAINGVHDFMAYSGLPVLIEEMGLGGGAHTDQEKADYLNVMYQAAFSHPQCAGMMQWGLQGPTFDGDWTLLGTPTGSNLDPATVWPDTIASNLLRTMGPANRNMRFGLTGAGTVTATQADVALSLVTGNVGTPIEAGGPGKLVLRKPGTPVRISGTVTLSAGSASTYRLSLLSVQQFAGTSTVVGTADVAAGSSQAFSIATTTPAGDEYTYRLQAQRISGVDGTITALDAALVVGGVFASPPAAPSPRAGKAVLRADGKLMLRADGKLTLMI